MSTCKSCRWWSGDSLFRKQGPCQLPVADGAMDGFQVKGYGQIVTGPDFGCIHHEHKPSLVMLPSGVDRATAEAVLRSTNESRHPGLMKVTVDPSMPADSFALCSGESEVRATMEGDRVDGRRFPILHQRYSIPWNMIAPHEPQAKRNHNQTLEELASRGGLSAEETLAVLDDMLWREMHELIERGRFRVGMSPEELAMIELCSRVVRQEVAQ